MLIDVLERFCADTGIDKTGQRVLAIKYLSEAAKDLHQMLECNDIFREVTVVVPPNKVVALPNFIGDIRGVRTVLSEQPFQVYPLMSPRYVKNTWQYKYQNWRQMAESPIHTSLNAIAPISIYTDFVEATPVTVTVSGETSLGATGSESIVVNNLGVATTKLFGLKIFSITCRDARTANLTIKSSGIEIATLYNNENFTRYKLVDVSEFAWTQDTTNGETLIDVLYKVPQVVLREDTDNFYAGPAYDNAWYNYAMYLFLKTKQGRMSDAMAFRGLAMQDEVIAKNSKEGDLDKQLSFGRNKFYGAVRRSEYGYGYADGWNWNGGYPW